MRRPSTLFLTGLFCILCSFSVFAQQNYFWVGGSGNWSEASTHWATASGGSTMHTIPPTANDNVFFDANSFNAADQTVTIPDGAVCKTMDWTGVTNNPTISAFIGNELHVYGSLIIPASVERDFAGYVRFKSTTSGNLVDLGGLPLRDPVNEYMYFEGVGGGWTLQSALTTDRIYLTAGSLNLNGQAVDIGTFITSGTQTRTLTMGSATVTCGVWDVQSATGLTLDAGTSNIVASFLVNGGGLTYHNLTIDGSVDVYDNNTWNTITLNEGTFLELGEGSNQTIGSLISNGTPSDPVTIQSVTSGSTATFTKSPSGPVTISYARIRDNIASGGTFTANNSVDLGNNTGWTIPATEPTTQVSSVTLLKVVQTSVTFNWTNGNGGKRIVVARAGGAVNSHPVDNTAYTPGAFGSGSEIGTGNFVVHSGSEDRATITGLAVGTTYHFRVYEFNGSGINVDYLTTVPAGAAVSATTLPSTATVISNSEVSVCSGNYYSSGGTYYYSNDEHFTQTLSPSTIGSKVRLNFTDFYTSGSGDVLKIYDGADTSAPLLGTYSGSTSPGMVTATNAEGKLTIHWVSDAFITSTGWVADISCITMDTQPTINSSGLGSSSSGTSFWFYWTSGNGARRMMVMRQGSAVNFTPTDGTDYAANSSFGDGADLGSGNYVVYNGTGSSDVTVTNLLPGTTYHIAVFEYNGANTSTNYLSPGYTGSRTTTAMAASPTLAPTDVTAAPHDWGLELNWTNGDGARRVIVVKEGAPVDAAPLDGAIYNTASFTTGTDLGNGNIVVGSTSENTYIVQGLAAGTDYHVAIFEFNGSIIGTYNYLTTTSGTSSGRTRDAEPEESPTWTDLLDKNFSSLKLGWTDADGDGRIVLISQGTESHIITDGVEYLADTVFGEGAEVSPGVFVVYSGPGDSVEITGLDPGTYYRVTIFEFNGNGIYRNYGPGSGLSRRTLLFKPTVQASNLAISEITATAMRLSWDPGNGNNSVVVIKKGSPVSAHPKDSTEAYNWSRSYSDGTSLGNGNRIIYANYMNDVTVTGLSPTTEYHFAVYAYNAESFPNYYYLSENPAVSSATTLAGKDYYWVGGAGNWTEPLHWATASGGDITHTTPPTSADDVYFDDKSFSNDGDTVLFDGPISVKDMDWSAVTKDVKFLATNCWTTINVHGSLITSEKVTSNISTLDFRATTADNIVDLNHVRADWCSQQLSFDGLDGHWTLKNVIGNIDYLEVVTGHLSIPEGTFNIDGIYLGTAGDGIDPVILDLGESRIGSLENFVTGKAGNVSINGGYLTFWRPDARFDAAGGTFKKVVVSAYSQPTITISGGASIDTLQFQKGTTVVLEAGKTIVFDTLIFAGDTTITSWIKSSVPGTAAVLSKAQGTVSIEHVTIRDNMATGGASFNAINSLDAGNTSGWTFTTPVLTIPKQSSPFLDYMRVHRSEMQLDWQDGDGTGRILVVKKGSAVDRTPEQGKHYTGSEIFGSGSDLGNGNYVVYAAASRAGYVPVTNLEPGATYHLALFEYNALGDEIKYKVDGPLTSRITMIAEEDFLMSNDPLTVCNVRYYDEGGRGYYDDKKDFTQTIYPATAGTKLGILFTHMNIGYPSRLEIFDGTTADPGALIGEYSKYSPPPASIIATNSDGALTFKLVTSASSALVTEYFGWEADLYCVGALAQAPQKQVSALTVTEKAVDSVLVSIGAGDGAGRVIIARESNEVNKIPADGADFHASSVFGQGKHLGDGNYMVYAGSADSVIISGLTENKRYYFAAYEYNGEGGSRKHLTDAPATANYLTPYAAPTIGASNFAINYTNQTALGFTFNYGNGDSRLALMRKDSPVTFVPEDRKRYQIGELVDTNTEVVISSSGWTHYNLEPNTTYHFAVIEYNGSGDRTSYLNSQILHGSGTTDGGPIQLTSSVADKYCPSQQISVTFRADENFIPGNEFRFLLSDEYGDFSKSIVLATVSTQTQMNAGSELTIDAIMPDTLPESDQYAIRVTSSWPEGRTKSSNQFYLPEVPPVTITAEDSVLTSSSTEHNQWYHNGNIIQGATEQTFRYTDGGIYTVKITVNGCSRTAVPFLTTANEENVFASDVQVYPNPATESVVIECKVPGTRYSIHDLNGREVKNGTLAGTRNEVDLRALPPGMYLIRVAHGQGIVSKILVKE